MRKDKSRNYVGFYDIETENSFYGRIYYIHALIDISNSEKLSKLPVFSEERNVIHKGFFQPKSFLRWLKKMVKVLGKNIDLYMFAHYGGGFDVVRLFPYLIKEFGVPTKILNVHGNILELKFSYKSSNIIFKDTYALIPIALKRFKETFNLKHGKVSLDVSNVENFNLLPKEKQEEIINYCKEDVFTLWEGYMKFQSLLERLFKKEIRLYKYLTLPSLAFEYFKQEQKRKNRVVVSYDNLLLRRAYHGGRTEIFKMWDKDGEFYKYDFNSMYPYCMTSFEYPIGEVIELDYPDISHEGISLVKIHNQKYQYIPYLPYKNYTWSMTRYNVRELKSGRLFFPYFDKPVLTVYTNYELRKAKQMGYNLEVIKSWITEEKGKIFDYINDLYQARKEYKKKGDLSMSVILKLIMNSTYGKFGQKRIREHLEIKEGNNPFALFNFEIDGRDYHIIGKKTYMKYMFSNILIASYITAYARTILFDKLKYHKAGEVLYSDTDSIFSKRKFGVSDRLGDLKLEDIGTEFYALQPKTYVYKSVNKNTYDIKAKGIDKSVIQQIEEVINKRESFENYSFRNSKDVLEFFKQRGVKTERAIKFKTYVREMKRIGIETFNKIYDNVKYIRSNYNKRNIDKETGITYPVKISEIVR